LNLLTNKQAGAFLRPLIHSVVILPGLALATASASASIVIETGLSGLPSGLAYQTLSDFGAPTSGSGEKDDRNITQTFTLDGAVDVDAFVLNIHRALDGASVTFRLFEVSNPDTDPFVAGTQLASEAYTFTTADESATADVGGNRTFSLLTWDITNINLAAGSYAVQIDGPDVPNAAIVWSTTTDNIAGGSFYRDGNVRNNGGSTAALGVVEVPEPASLVLLGLGSLCLMGRTRR